MVALSAGNRPVVAIAGSKGRFGPVGLVELPAVKLEKSFTGTGADCCHLADFPDDGRDIVSYGLLGVLFISGQYLPLHDFTIVCRFFQTGPPGLTIASERGDFYRCMNTSLQNILV